VLGLIALRATRTIVERNKKIIAANLELLNAFFERHTSLWEWTPPQAGTVGFARLLTGESADSFCERLRVASNVLLLPSSVYDYVEPGEERVRIGFGRESLPGVLKLLEAFLAADKGGNR
jgi:aspartate/methionine/tyrosine aminotransferase